jgi:dolichyl-phosphate beta-glucosyltransferase
MPTDGAADGKLSLIMNTKTDVSLIIPVYNETVRLVSGLEKMLLYLTRQRFTWELILVDDGSTTPVSQVIKKAVQQKILRFTLAKLPFFIYRLPKNMGKGRAIALGVSRARGGAIVFTDVDQSVPIETIKPLLSALKRYPVVIGSRRTMGAKIVVHQSIVRETSGRMFTFLSDLLCNANVTDVTCGFKGFRREPGKSLFKQQLIHRWVFDTEIVFLARKKGLDIYELPVSWVNKSGSKVRPWDSVASLADLFKIRWNDIMGYYNN